MRTTISLLFGAIVPLTFVALCLITKPATSIALPLTVTVLALQIPAVFLNRA